MTMSLAPQAQAVCNVPVSDMLSEREAAAYIGITHPTLHYRRQAGTGPAFTQPKGPGGRVFYKVEDLDEWAKDYVPRTRMKSGGIPRQVRMTFANRMAQLVEVNAHRLSDAEVDMLINVLKKGRNNDCSVSSTE